MSTILTNRGHLWLIPLLSLLLPLTACRTGAEDDSPPAASGGDTTTTTTTGFGRTTVRNGSGEQMQVTIYGTGPSGTSVVYWDGPMRAGGTCGMDTAAGIRVYVGAAREYPATGSWEVRIAIHDGADHEVVIPPLGRG